MKKRFLSPTQTHWEWASGTLFGMLMGIFLVGTIVWFLRPVASPPRPNYPYSVMGIGGESVFGVSEATLFNPIAPPLRDERYFVPAMPKMAINIPTSGVETNYRQIGILSPLNQPADKNVLILMGRPLNTNRQKWQYYSISNQFNGVKLPIRVKGRNATYEYGVDELFSGDNVLVEGNQGLYQVTKYENDVIRYL